ncbi:hypothetical protein EDB80DRAFT_676871 [Ilyonectria destructans]|nr:hypothetical protein EDB80DRAFT_676871 [Ilyonectria destructans]
MLCESRTRDSGTVFALKTVEVFLKHQVLTQQLHLRTRINDDPRLTSPSHLYLDSTPPSENEGNGDDSQAADGEGAIPAQSDDQSDLDESGPNDDEDGEDDEDDDVDKDDKETTSKDTVTTSLWERSRT